MKVKNIGIELEFFVKEISTGKIVPAYTVTRSLDGDPFIGEIKTGIHNNAYKLFYELKRLVHEENDNLNELGYEVSILPEYKMSNSQYLDLRKDRNYINNKELDLLEVFSIYNRKAQKVLPRLLRKTSLQLNISENSKIYYTDNNEEKFRYYSELFDYIPIIKSLDDNFSEEISDTNRIKGVCSFKEGDYGKRLEYRSLPSSIDLNKLLNILKEIYD